MFKKKIKLKLFSFAKIYRCIFFPQYKVLKKKNTVDAVFINNVHFFVVSFSHENPTIQKGGQFQNGM